MTLTIDPTMKPFGSRTGDDVIHSLSLRDTLVGHITNIPAAHIFILATWWQLDHHLDHLKGSLVVLAPSYFFAERHVGNRDNNRHHTDEDQCTHQRCDQITHAHPSFILMLSDVYLPASIYC